MLPWCLPTSFCSVWCMVHEMSFERNQNGCHCNHLGYRIRRISAILPPNFSILGIIGTILHKTIDSIPTSSRGFDINRIFQTSLCNNTAAYIQRMDPYVGSEYKTCIHCKKYTRQKTKRTTTIFPLRSPFNTKMLIVMNCLLLIKFN